MNQRSTIADVLSRVLASPPWNLSLSKEQIEPLLEIPKDRSRGDWALPCFFLAKQLRQSPQAIAKQLSGAFANMPDGRDAFASVESEGPYVNFKVDKGSVAAEIIPAILNGSFLGRKPRNSIKIMVEYSNPNTHKAFHVGHVRCASLGDSVARILDWNGFDVVPANYIGDEGAHVAKCLWMYTKEPNRVVPMENRGEFFGKFYSDAVSMLDLSTLTEAPVEQVTAAKILSTRVHPNDANFTVIKLQTKFGERQIVTALHGAKPEDLIPYVEAGVVFDGKKIEISEIKGVRSEGMICSEKEIGVSDDNDTLPVLSATAHIGDEIAELYRFPNVKIGSESVLAEMSRRKAEVGAVLQALECGESPIKELWLETRQWSLDELHDNYRWLNCRFEHDFTESEVGEEGRRLVLEYYEKGVFVKSESAIGADLSAFGLGFCLLLRSDGTAMYAARDLALAKRKFEQFKIDRSLYVVDVAQSFHFKQVFKCLELMGYKEVSQCFHLSYGMVVLPEGKMSSRKGTVIFFSRLKDRLIGKIRNEFLNKYSEEWPEAEVSETAHRLALATIRYGMLYPDNNSNIIFDLNAWTARTGNTGPYLMYAYARTRSILREVGALDRSAVEWSLLSHETETEIIQLLASYRDVVIRSSEYFAPSVVCAYAYELAKKFNRMYVHCSVTNAETPLLKSSRISIVEAAGLVLRHALGLLGIPTVERM